MSAPQEVGERRLLVIGSQCPPLGTLSFLPEAATDFCSAMVDPLRGACRPALADGRALLLDPTGEDAEDAYRTALRGAARVGARLLVGLVGHGLFDGTSFYFLLTDSLDDDGLLEPRKALKPIEAADEEKRSQAANLDGLLLLVDACYAGMAVERAASDLARMASAAWRFEILSASDDREAADGCFTRTLTEFIQKGLPQEPTLPTLHCAKLRPRLLVRCAHQEAQHAAHNADDALWLCRNFALEAAAAPWAGTRAAGEVTRLTRDFQPVPALADIVARAKGAGCLAIVAGAGQGKSALCAALARPEVAAGAVPERYLDAIAFIDQSMTSEDLAALISTQLTTSIADFRGVAHGIEYSTPASEWASLGAMERQVLRPLGAIGARQGTAAPVRIAIDGLDRIPDAARTGLERDLAAVGRLPGVRLIVSARPGAWLPPDAERYELEAAPRQALAAYLATVGAPETLAGQLGESWLTVRLAGELLGAAPAGVPAEWVSEDEPPEQGEADRGRLGALYEDVIDQLLMRSELGWAQLRPLMGPLAVAGSGPVLPLGLLGAASGRLGGPTERVALLDLLTHAGPLVVRSDAGTPEERLGLFHQTLAAHLLASERHDVDEPQAHQALVGAIEELAPAQDLASTDPVQLYATAREAEHLWALGEYERATAAREARLLALPRENLEAWRRWAERADAVLGPEHRDTLATRGNIAHWTGETGDRVEALRLFLELRPILERVTGPEHPDMLSNRANIAAWTGETGGGAGALRLFKELLPIHERVLGPEHPSTLRIRANIATWTGQTGDRVEALRLYRELRPIYKRVLGPEHPDTLTTMNNIAHWTGHTGDSAGALRLFEELLPIRQRVLGPEHPETLSTRSNIAAWTGETGDSAEALRLYRELLPIRERVLGPDHPDTLTTRHNFAGWTGATGNSAEALRLFEELIPIYERVLGPEHPNTLTVRSALRRLEQKASA
jgi:hypothetical protein